MHLRNSLDVGKHKDGVVQQELDHVNDVVAVTKEEVGN